jgi:hypothetical protein
MITRTRLVYVSVSAAAAAFAWQGGLGSVGWADADASKIAEAYFSVDYVDALPGINFLSGPVRKQWLARSGADRAVAIRDLAVYAKRFVSSPNFEKVYDGWIREHFNAINHGLKLDAAQPASDAQLQQMGNAALAETMQMFGQMEAGMLKMMFDTDVFGWKDGGDEDKKWLSRARQIEPLAKSNPAEFKKQYVLLKSASLGGRSTEAELKAASAKGAEMAADGKKREEQEKYDSHKLRVVLKQRLGDFVQLARSVDFAAQTKTVNGKHIFVNPDYESKSDLWKKLYRLGKEPSTAALGVAEQWLKEL